MSIKLSVIMPSLNVADYIEECMDSVLCQTLHEIEIISVDAGSTDGTEQILEKYAKADSRIRLIQSDKKSYGAQVNQGIREAVGKYIAVLETDDYIMPEMYDKLLEAAKTNDLDFVMMNFADFYDDGNQRVFGELRILAKMPEKYGKILSLEDISEFVGITDSTLWRGIYRRDFLLNNNIWLNETPGASFQDIAFMHFVRIKAKRSMYLDDVGYCYRIDRAEASSYSGNGIKYVNWEYRYFLERESVPKVYRQRFYCIMAETVLDEANKSLVKNGYVWDEEDASCCEWLRLTIKKAWDNGDFFADARANIRWDRLILFLNSIDDYADAYRSEIQKTEKKKENMEKAKKIIRRMSEGILNWYPFGSDRTVLCVENDNDILSEGLKRLGLTVVTATIRECAKTAFLDSYKNNFDYVVAIGQLERCYEPSKILSCWKSMLRDTGKLLLGTENRLGIRYFCGDKDPFTYKCFDGVEGYISRDHRNIKVMGGRLYAKYEIEAILDLADFPYRKFYSVFPDLMTPKLIYAEDYLPNEDLAMRCSYSYHSPDTVFIDERHLYDGLIKNNMFLEMANAYLVECSLDGDHSAIDHVTLSADRGEEDAFATVITDRSQVMKLPLYEAGIKKLEGFINNLNDLKLRGLKVVDMDLDIERGIGVMPYMDAPLGNIYMQELLARDKDGFVELMDRFRDLILMSSEHEEENELGIILKRGYVDLVPLNCFFADGDFVFFDQEFYFEHYPANAILHRAISIIYDGEPAREGILPSSFFWERYGLDSKIDLWAEYSDRFTDSLKNKDLLSDFDSMRVPDFSVVRANRSRMDIPEIYRGLKERDCFEGLSGKKVYLFGSGNYAKKFLAFYKDEYDIAGIFDNAQNKAGTVLDGFVVNSPESLDMISEDCRIIICAKKYEDIYKQLLRHGVDDKNISVYDADRVYSGRQRDLRTAAKVAGTNAPAGIAKKYHIGYIAGVFDLYHIGHLNLFRRAKEQCDYLIVGVTSDDYVIKQKHKEPFVPFEERIEMVRSCRYVDEAVAIPFEYGGTVEAFQKYHFDVQFSGSDYVNDPWWLEQQKYLREHGADLYFFPYTEQTNSTKIKGLIDKGLA